MLGSAAIKQRAAELGFDLCGIAPAHNFPELGFLQTWLGRGYAGEMRYMEKSAHVRADIRNFLPSARSVIVTGTIYNTERRGWDRSTRSRPASQAASSLTAGRVTGSDTIRVARYARGQDYHKVIEARLLALIEWLRSQTDQAVDAAHFVDKHPVQERVYALHAGLGWIGKNSCLINADEGSWMFLAGVATSLALEPDAPALDQCGSCTLCIDACPTGALVDARELDATKCISYLTIETRRDIPEAQRQLIGQHAWGCDICQDVCPWNLASSITSDAAWHGPIRDGCSASELWQQTDDELHDRIAGSAMTFVPLSRLRRNLAIVMGNSGDAELLPSLDRAGRGVTKAARSAQTPAVQDAVAWARERLTRS